MPGSVFPLSPSPQQTSIPPSDLRTGLYHANFADVQMDELNLEKAYSIGRIIAMMMMMIMMMIMMTFSPDYYKRMFYPEVPCKQCEHCWRVGY